MFLNNFIKKSKILKNVRWKLNNQNIRDKFIITELEKLSNGLSILDAGCGSQRYKKYCDHLKYYSNDTGNYTLDKKKNLFSNGINKIGNYEYGNIDYKSNIWNIDAETAKFDAILCTEVFEHIPYPEKALIEFNRLLKTDGKLILTIPSNCLRHMDPEYYFSGFSDNWIKKFMKESKFKIQEIQTIGDYYSWMAVEISRTAMISSILTKIILFPSFLYFFLKKKTVRSTNTLCMGYHIIATKEE